MLPDNQTLRTMKRADGAIEMQRVYASPLSFLFRLAPITYSDPLSAERTATVHAAISQARAYARPSPDSDALNWLFLDTIVACEMGVSGIRRLGLPAGEQRLDFALPVAAMSKLGEMTEFVIAAEWVSTSIEYGGIRDTDPGDERALFENALWLDWCRDLVSTGVKGTFEYVAPIIVGDRGPVIGDGGTQDDRRTAALKLLDPPRAGKKPLIAV